MRLRFWEPTLRTWIAVLGVVSLQSTMGFAAGQPRFVDPHAQVILEDVEVQNALDQFHDNPEASKCFEQAVGPLRSIAGVQYQRLIPQFVIHQIRMEDEPNTDVVEAMLPHYLIARMDITATDIVLALLPYLGNDDSKQQRIIKQYFARTEAVQSGGPPDFSHYQSLISGRYRSGMPIPRALVIYLFEANANAALLTMNTVIDGWDARRPIIWAEHQVADVQWKWNNQFLAKDEVEAVAKEALLKIADSKQWWVRLYVAIIMREYPPFRDEAVLDRFEGDTDESVRAAVADLTAEPGTK